MNAEAATNFVEVFFANHACCVSSHHRKCKKCTYRNGKNFRNGDKNSVIKLSNFRTNFLVTFRVSYRCREEERLSIAPIGNVYIIYYMLYTIYYILFFRCPCYRCREEERLSKAPIGNVGVCEIHSTTTACHHRADVLVQVVTWV